MSDNNPVEVLLVEDNPSDLQLALRVLKEQSPGDNIRVARDGEEALDFIFSRGPYEAQPLKVLPKVILLDLKLPLVDGIEVLREIRANPRTKHIPVVAMTASGNERDVAECYALGVNSYIQKPLDFDHFRRAMQIIAIYWLTLNRPPLSQQCDNT
jgi:two-component system, response regulator